MQLANSLNSYSINPMFDKQTPNIKNNDVSNKIQINIEDDNNSEIKTLKTMSLDEIKVYLETNNIEDDTDTRANALFDIQKFADKIDSTTYNKMTTSLLEEESSSRASMRYSSFPSENLLEEDEAMFHAMLETTLDIKDTVHSLIFTLDLKKDLSDYQQNMENFEKPASIDLDLDFDMLSFIGFMKKKMDEVEEDMKDGTSVSEENRMKDYSALLGNYNKFNEEKSDTTIDISV